MLEASDKIANQELDFEIGSSNIKEFNDVLNSLDIMKKALSDSLRENVGLKKRIREVRYRH